jgi:hypothetical protein
MLIRRLALAAALASTLAGCSLIGLTLGAAVDSGRPPAPPPPPPPPERPLDPGPYYFAENLDDAARRGAKPEADEGNQSAAVTGAVVGLVIDLAIVAAGVSGGGFGE